MPSQEPHGHSDFTKSVFILIVTVTVVASFSALAWVVPNQFTMSARDLKSTRPPQTAVELTRRDIYIILFS